MPDYKTMYFKMAGQMATAVETLEKLRAEMISTAQLCEGIYVESEPPIEIARPDGKKK